MNSVKQAKVVKKEFDFFGFLVTANEYKTADSTDLVNDRSLK